MTRSAIPYWALELVQGLPALATKHEAAKFLRRSERQLSRDIAIGRLRAIKTASGGSGRVLISRRELARFLASLEQEPQVGGGE